jgi:hypothetical protein
MCMCMCVWSLLTGKASPKCSDQKMQKTVCVCVYIYIYIYICRELTGSLSTLEVHEAVIKKIQ